MYHGDFLAGDTVDLKFTTRDAGVPFTLAGSPAISVYKANSTTQSTAGVTLTVDFDSVTGLNHVRITTSSDATFYAAASDFQVVITTGTVNGNSVVGEVVASFSIANRSSLNVVRRNTAQSGSTAQIRLDASASGTTDLYKGMTVSTIAGTGAGQTRTVTGYNGTTKNATVDRLFVTAPDSTSVFILQPVNVPGLNASLQVPAASSLVAIHTGTAQAGAATTITLDTGALATNDIYNNAIVTITGGTGLGQTRTILDYVGATKVATVDRAWVTNPDNTSTFAVYASTTASQFSDAGVAQAGGASSITLASTASAVNDVYNGSLVTILAGTGSGQTRLISDYDGTTKVVTTSAAWSVTPDSTSVYAVLPTAAADPSQVAPSAPVIASTILTTNLTELYAADGAVPTLEQSLMMILQFLFERTVAGTTLTVKKLDGSTTAMTFTLNSATQPTSQTRST